MRNIQVNFGDILPETSKSSAFWDIGLNSNLKWLPLFSPNEAGKSDGTCQQVWGPLQEVKGARRTGIGTVEAFLLL